MGRSFGAIAVLIFSCLSALAEPAIDWRVKHPFRFFTDTIDFDMQREALAEIMVANGGTLPATAVSDLERVLNDPRWLREWYRENPSKYDDVKRTGRAERGWANHINLRARSCWFWRNQSHANCRSDVFGQTRPTDYVLPQRHTVVFSVIAPPEGQCRWRADINIFLTGAPLLAGSVERPCAEAVEARIPFEPWRPEAERGVDVRVLTPGGTELAQPKVWVRDRLIAGIGDSFSSGEGNPDTPVEIHPRSNRWRVNHAFYYRESAKAIDRDKGFLPVRGDNGPAGWLDRKCHRSVYSYHLRTALQVALADPKHSAVTFLGFACSGAEITEGLIQPYKGAENVDPELMTPGGRQRRDLAQVDRLMLELCRDNLLATGRTHRLDFNPPLTGPSGEAVRRVDLLDCPANRFLRPIDMLIISIGGNDVGFTPLITNVLTATSPPYARQGIAVWATLEGRRAIERIARIFGSLDIADAEEKADELPRRFDALRRALASLPIAKNSAGRPNVVLTAFPKIEFNEEGRLCGLDDERERMEGFTIGGMLVIDKTQLAAVSAFANDRLYPATRDAAAAANWHFVDSHRNLFQRHGVCAQKRPSSGVTAIENMALPYYQDAPVPKWFGFEPFSADRETGFKAARDTRPYAPRQRWFRTMADICLFVHFRQKGSPPAPGKWGLADVIEACLGGPFHPTAEGHAHIADAVYLQAKAMLGLPTPTVDILRPPR